MNLLDLLTRAARLRLAIRLRLPAFSLVAGMQVDVAVRRALP